MPRSARVLVVSVVTVVLGASFVSPAAGDPIRDLLPWDRTQGCSAPGSDDRCETWTAEFHDPQAAIDSKQFPNALVTSPDDRTVYMAAMNGTGSGFDSKSRWAIVALDAATGENLWVAQWGDPNDYSFPSAVGVSSHGDVVVATGTTRHSFSDPDGRLTTIAFEASSGEVLWESSYDGSPGGNDTGRWIVMDPKRDTFYVAGVSQGVGGGGDLDYVMLAYDIATGEQRWATRYAGIGVDGVDSPFALGIDPKGDAIFVTGWSAGPGEFDLDYGTIALSTESGTLLWEARYDGVGVDAPDVASALAVSPKGDRVIVTGYSDDVDGGPPFAVNYDYATVAYDAATGEQVWVARTRWEGSNFNVPTAIAADTKGDAVYVTGQVTDKESDDLDYGTVAYSLEDGTELWSDRFGTTEYDLELGKAIGVSKNGKSVYVTGVSSSSSTSALFLNEAQVGDQVTLGYDAETGERDWVARFNATGFDFDRGELMAMSNDGRMLFTAGTFTHNVDLDRNFYDAGVVAYTLDDLDD